jgi:O-antigen chain-terminating methyltransferase
LDDDSPDLRALREKLVAEESAYAEVLATVDALAAFPLPAETLHELPAQRERLNDAWRTALAPQGGLLAPKVWAAVAPALQRQEQWNASVVQILNGQLEENARLHARLRDLAAAVVRYLQRVQPLMDARDRMATALATTRSELILEAFDRRLESLARRLSGLFALRDRVEAVSEETRAILASLERRPASPEQAAEAGRAAKDSAYVAFENRFRGAPEEISERLRNYVPLFRERGPVLDLGCGRGEFLALLKDAGVAARGVEANARMVEASRARGLDVVRGDLLDFLRSEKEGGLGGVFAAQVAEHLPPAVLQGLLAEAFRVLRKGGLLALETVNPRSVVGFLEVYNRDLTHERPLHPDTLAFLAAAAGFSDVRVEYRSPVDAASRLQPVPPNGLPEPAARVLNENVERLNAVIYAPQEYVLFATR